MVFIEQIASEAGREVHAYEEMVIQFLAAGGIGGAEDVAENREGHNEFCGSKGSGSGWGEVTEGDGDFSYFDGPGLEAAGGRANEGGEVYVHTL